MSHPDPRDAPNLLADVIRNASTLMQKEVQLAKTEIAANASRAGVGIALFAIAGILAVIGLNVLVGALVAYLAATSLSAGTAAVIVGGTVLALAIVLALLGKARLSASALKPKRTMANIQRDVAAVKGATNV